jgi:hypothetical protein
VCGGIYKGSYAHVFEGGGDTAVVSLIRQKEVVVLEWSSLVPCPAKS